MDVCKDGMDTSADMTVHAPPHADTIHPGMRVVIVGLQRATEHNGRICLVGDVQPSGRWAVVLDHNGQTLQVKPENLKVHQAMLPGTRVFVHGVTGELNTFNGRIGVVDKIHDDATANVLVQAFAEGNGPTTTFKGVPMCNLCLMSTDFMVNGHAAKARGTSLKMKQSELSETECKQTNVVIVRLPRHMNTNDLLPNDYDIVQNCLTVNLKAKINGVVSQIFSNDHTDTVNGLITYAEQCKLVIAHDPDTGIALPCCMNPMCLKACPSGTLQACMFCNMPRYCSRLCKEKDTVHHTNCWPGVDMHFVHEV
tara:strand:- start:4703 stop:5632 length:930 start_codon:yes stop_codon:yes gene_type:complete